MKRFFKRLVDTGAIYWFAISALMLLGSGMAWDVHGVVLSGGKMGSHDGGGGGSLTIHQAALFWLGIAVMTSVIGIRILRETKTKR